MNYRRPPPSIDSMISLKVDNLTYRTTPEDLRRLFGRCGELGDIYIPRDRFTRESRGFAFVRYYDKRDAEDALDAMDGYTLDGREIRVQLARYGRPMSPNGRRLRFYHRRSNSRGRSRSRSCSRRRSRSRSHKKQSSSSSSHSESDSTGDGCKSRSGSKSSDRYDGKSRSKSKS